MLPVARRTRPAGWSGRAMARGRSQFHVGALGSLARAHPPRGSRAFMRRFLLPHLRQRVALMALREEHCMHIFMCSVLASASGNLPMRSPVEGPMGDAVYNPDGSFQDCTKMFMP